MLLPILTPAVEGITWLLNLFGDALKAIPSSLEPVFGAVMLVVGGLVTIWGALTAVSGVLSAAGIGFAGLGVGGSAAGAMLGGLSAIIGAISWPLLLVIGIVISAIYVWKTWSKEIIALKDALISGDWGTAAELIGNSFDYVKDGIWNALKGAGEAIWNFFTALPGMIGQSAGTLVSMGNQLIHWLIEGITSLSGYLSEVITGMLVDEAGAAASSGGQSAGESGGKSLIDGLKQWIIDNGPTIMDSITTTFWTLLPLILQLLWQILTIITIYLFTGAQNAGRQFVYGIISWIQQLPGRVWAFLLQVISRVLSFGSQAGSRARSAAQQMYNGIRSGVSQIPGMVYNELLRIIGRITSIGGAAYDAAYRLGQNVYNGIKAALGIGSPGYMYYMMEGELDRIQKLMTARETPFQAGSYQLGDRITTGFTGATAATVNTNNSSTAVNVNVDVTGAPQGNSDKAIADMVLTGLTKDRRVIDGISKALKSSQGRSNRAQGV
jgi:hypothetical protein